MRTKLVVEIEIDEAVDKEHLAIDAEQISAWMNLAWQSFDLNLSPIKAEQIKKIKQISLYFCNEEAIKKLNYQFRNQDKPTNVLSFPAFDFVKETSIGEFSAINCLGDLVFCPKVILDEAETKYKKEKMTHFAHLLVHGLLHLCGFDHQDETNQLIMEKEEIKILKKIGFGNPYLY